MRRNVCGASRSAVGTMMRVMNRKSVHIKLVRHDAVNVVKFFGRLSSSLAGHYQFLTLLINLRLREMRWRGAGVSVPNPMSME